MDSRFKRSRAISPDVNKAKIVNIIPESNEFSHVVKVLSKQPKDRTKADLRFLATFFSDKYNFFKKLKAENDIERIEALLSMFQIERHENGNDIIRCGDVGQKFYIIIKGKLSIYVPNTIEKEMKARDYIKRIHFIKYFEHNDAKFKRYEEYNRNLINYSLLKACNYNTANIKFDVDYKKVFKIEEDKLIGTINEGEEFGEVALTEKGPSEITIKSEGDCIFAVLERFDYNRIQKQIEDKKYNDMLEDLRTNYIMFRNWSKRCLMKLMVHIKKLNLTIGQTLYEQNTNSDSIILTINGQYEVFCNIDINNSESFVDFINNLNRNSIFKYFQNSKTQVSEKEYLEFLEKFGISYVI